MKSGKKKSADDLSYENERVETVKKYEELNIRNAKNLQDIVSMASSICQVPVALITFIDKDKQKFMAKVGIEGEETPREVAFCNYTIQQNDLMIIPDALANPDVKANPYVTGNPFIRFYAGATLQSADGYNVGSLCVIDFKPNRLTEHQQECLRLLSKQAIQFMELKLRDKKK